MSWRVRVAMTCLAGLVAASTVAAAEGARDRYSIYDKDSRRIGEVQKRGSEYEIFDDRGQRLGRARPAPGRPDVIELFDPYGRRGLELPERKKE
jgi:hypothetical protein